MTRNQLLGCVALILIASGCTITPGPDIAPEATTASECTSGAVADHLSEAARLGGFVVPDGWSAGTDGPYANSLISPQELADQTNLPCSAAFFSVDSANEVALASVTWSPGGSIIGIVRVTSLPEVLTAQDEERFIESVGTVLGASQGDFFLGYYEFDEPVILIERNGAYPVGAESPTG